MTALKSKSDSKAKQVHIAAGVTSLIVLAFVLVIGIFDTEFLPFLFFFYTLILLVTWRLVLISVKAFRVSRAMFPGLWVLVLGLVMLAAGFSSLLILTSETDMGYGFIVFLLVIGPGFWVTLVGFLSLLVGKIFDVVRRRRHAKGLEASV